MIGGAVLVAGRYLPPMPTTTPRADRCAEVMRKMSAEKAAPGSFIARAKRLNGCFGPGGDISLSDFLGRLLGEFTATLDEELCHGADGAVLQDDDANRRVAKWLFDGQDF